MRKWPLLLFTMAGRKILTHHSRARTLTLKVLRDGSAGSILVEALKGGHAHFIVSLRAREDWLPTRYPGIRNEGRRLTCSG